MEETAKRTQFMGDESITAARPIRELLPRELEFYFKFNKLDQYISEPLSLTSELKGKAASLPGKGDFSAVIDAFLSNLQVRLILME